MDSNEFLTLFQAFQKLYSRVSETSEHDPSQDGSALQAKVIFALHAALLLGELHGHVRCGAEWRLVPGWAWQAGGPNGHDQILGWKMYFNPFIPSPLCDYKEGSCHVLKSQFEDWLGGGIEIEQGELPAFPDAYDRADVPRPLPFVELPSDGFISLTEAITWLAFGSALTGDGLYAVEYLKYGPCSQPDYTAKMEAAVARFSKRASDSDAPIRVRGRQVDDYYCDRSRRLAATKPMDADNLRDHAFFDAWRDGLQRGSGVKFGQEKIFRSVENSKGWLDVQVCREDLERNFWNEVQAARGNDGMTMPSPLAVTDLPADEQAFLPALGRDALTEAYWPWPEALTWSGTGDINAVAAIRTRFTAWTQSVPPNEPDLANEIAAEIAAGFGELVCGISRDEVVRRLVERVQAAKIKVTAARESGGEPDFLDPIKWVGATVRARNRSFALEGKNKKPFAFDLMFCVEDLVREYPPRISDQVQVGAAAPTPIADGSEQVPSDPEARRWFYLGERASRELGDDVAGLVAEYKTKGLDHSGVVTKAIYREAMAALDRLIDAHISSIRTMSDNSPARAALEALAGNGRRHIMAHSYYAAPDSPAQIRGSEALAARLFERVSLLFADAPTVDEPNPAQRSKPDKAALEELAAQLDRDDVLVRDLRQHHVTTRWSHHNGPAPKLDSVRFQMVGGKKGRKPGS